MTIDEALPVSDEDHAHPIWSSSHEEIVCF